MYDSNALRSSVSSGRTAPTLFFGRDATLLIVENELRSPTKSAVALWGPRRIGKTSTLLKLLRALPPSFLPIYFDVLGQGTLPLGRLLAELAFAIARGAALPAPDAALFDDQGHHFREVFLEDLFRLLGEDRRLVLLLDQLDLLDVRDRPQVPSLLAFLRQLMEQDARLKLVIALSRAIEELPAEFKALLRGVRGEQLSVLDEASARQLIQATQDEGTQTFTAPAVTRLCALSGRHPCLLRLLCDVLKERFAAAPSSGPLTIDVPDLDGALEEVLHAGESSFEWIWDGIPIAERVVLSALASAEGGEDRSAQQITALLAESGISDMTGEMQRAPERLVARELLAGGAGGYRFSAELFRCWVASRKPLARVKEDLDALIPVSESLYLSGLGLYRQRALGPVPELLRHALRVDPGHHKARLLLGQVLLEEGQLTDALEALEEAYRLGPQASGALLLRALLLRADERQRASDHEGAIAALARAQAVAPDDQAVQDRLVAAWLRRGDEALGRGDLDEAQRAYSAAGASEKAAQVEEQRRRRQSEQLEERARRELSAGAWEQAAHLYEELIDQDPDNDRFRAALSEAKTEMELARRYAQGTSLLSQGAAHHAVPVLAGVVHLRPGYRDAAALLGRALGKAERPKGPPASGAGRRSERWLAIGLGVGFLLGTAVGMRAWRAPQPLQAQVVSPDEEAAMRLHQVDAAMLAQRFQEARGLAEQVLARQDITARTREVALAKSDLAAREQQAAEIYREFRSSLDSPMDLSKANHLYGQISTRSIYYEMARPYFERIVPLLVEERVAQAEAARRAGRCADFREKLAGAISLDPGSAAALDFMRRPCREAAPRAQAQAQERPAAVPAPATP